jgi:hypothetical protein
MSSAKQSRLTAETADAAEIVENKNLGHSLRAPRALR